MEPAVRTRIHIVTGPYFDVPDVVHDGTDCKMCYYYYENFSVPRTGSVLEAPLGYWSAYAEDWPIEAESLSASAACHPSKINQFLGRAPNGIVSYLQRCEESNTATEPQRAEFMSEVRCVQVLLYGI